jgi:hypothetical protein
MFTIYGAALNPITGMWRAFNEETLTILSEHSTEHGALAACRHYTECEMRRMQSRDPIGRVRSFAFDKLARYAI